MQRSEPSRGECLRAGHAVRDQLPCNFGSAATAACSNADVSAAAHANADAIADTAKHANAGSSADAISGTTASADNDER